MPRRVPNFSRTAALTVCLVVVFGTIVSRNATAQENPVVVLQTNHGSITIELLQTDAPVSVENFLAYVNDGFYENTVFHRVIQQFMIQGGGMTADLAAKRTRPPIQNEARNGVTNARGTVAMARTNIVDSATAQFFINTADNARSLDHSGLDPAGYGYAVFGRVTEGMDVVDSIAAVQTQSQGPYDDVPTESVVIQSVTVQ
jgi:cyclophilin family peptidyl-prolyl cis-trans isomerase